MSAAAGVGTHRDRILDGWRRRIFATYAEPTAKILARGRDRFRNPAGSIIRTGTEEALDALLRGAPRSEIASSLDGMVRLRAVQDFSPGEAVGFVFALRDAAREALGDEEGSAERLADFDRRVDSLALIAFEIYTGCREQIMDLRVQETKARVMKLLERAGATGGDLEEKSSGG